MNRNVLYRNAITFLTLVFAAGISAADKPAPSAETPDAQPVPVRLHRGKDPDGWTYLAYVRPFSYSVGHGDLGRFQQGEKKLVLAGTPFETGLVAHAVSSVRYRLAGKCKEFRASYGLPYGSVARFVVRCDGEEKFRSGRVWATGGTRRHGIDKPIHLDVAGVDILELVTYGDNNGQTAGSFAGWGDPKVR